MKGTPEAQDRDLTLGAPIRQAKPAAAPVPVAPGVVKNADGKLETNAPLPPNPWWVAPVVVSDGQAEDWEGIE